MNSFRLGWILKPRVLTFISLLWLQVAAGQTAPETYTYDIAPGTGPLLWNVSGYYTGEPFWITLYNQDAKGRVWSGNTAVGSVTGNGRVTRARFTLRDSYWETSYFIGGVTINRTRSLALTIDTNALAMSGLKRTTTKRVEVVLWQRRTLSTTVVDEFVTVPLPEGNDGRWTLTLNVVPNGNKLAGTAAIQFANGATLQFQLMGKRDPAKGKSKLVLVGAGQDKGASLQVTLGGSGMEIESLRGTVSGQAVRFPGGPAPR